MCRSDKNSQSRWLPYRWKNFQPACRYVFHREIQRCDCRCWSRSPPITGGASPPRPHLRISSRNWPVRRWITILNESKQQLITYLKIFPSCVVLRVRCKRRSGCNGHEQHRNDQDIHFVKIISGVAYLIRVGNALWKWSNAGAYLYRNADQGVCLCQHKCRGAGVLVQLMIHFV